MWSAANGQCLKIFRGHGGHDTRSEGFATSIGKNYGLAWVSTLLFTAAQKRCRLWNVKTGECQVQVVHPYEVEEAKFSPCSSKVLRKRHCWRRFSLVVVDGYIAVIAFCRDIAMNIQNRYWQKKNSAAKAWQCGCGGRRTEETYTHSFRECLYWRLTK